MHIDDVTVAKAEWAQERAFITPVELANILQRRPPPSLTNTQSSIPSAAAQPPPPPAAATFRPLSDSDDNDSDDDELRALKQEAAAAAAANSAKSRNLAQEEDELEETEEDIRRVAEDLSRETGMSYAEVRELLDEQRRERTRAAQSEPRGYDRVQPQPPSTEATTNDHHSGEGEDGEELTQEERWRQQLAELVPNRNSHYHSPQKGKYNEDSDSEEFSLEALRAKKKKAAHDAVLGHLSTKRGDVEKPKSLSNTSSIHVKVYEAQMTRRREVQEEKAETKRQAELDAAKERRMKGIFANLQIAKKLKGETTVRGNEVSSDDTR